MKHKIFVWVSIGILALMAAMPALAQDTTTQRTIEVTGVGTAYGTPDTATVEVGVDIQDADFSKAFESTNDVMAVVLDKITELGIASEDIQTTSINVWFEDNRDPQSGTPTGERIYHVTQSMRIVVRNIDLIGDVISTAVDNGANQIFGLNFSFADTDGLETQARETAVDNARAKAQHLADLLGVELGDVVSVVELGSSSGGPTPARGGVSMMDAANVSPGQLSVSANVQLTFAIQ